MAKGSFCPVARVIGLLVADAPPAPLVLLVVELLAAELLAAELLAVEAPALPVPLVAELLAC